MAFVVPTFDFNFGSMTAFDYQQDVHNKCMDYIRNKNAEPAFVYASVSAGKSLMMAMIAKHFQNVRDSAIAQNYNVDGKFQVMIIARQGELAKQDHDECWAIGVRASVYSASINKPKDVNKLMPVICATEGTVYNELNKALASYVPTVLLIDECHQFPFDDDDTQYKKIVAEFKLRNPNLKIIGYTGSPWRGRDSIKGEFWKEQLSSIDRQYLTERGFVMPTLFGFGSAHYQLDMDFKPEFESTSDLSKSQLATMENQILADKTTTQKIMAEVQEIMANRNLALITCSGRKHCEEAAKYLTENEYVIITEKTTPKERLKIKDRCNNGDIKYVLQIGTWTTGVSINRLDTVVILRRIGSMSLYEQLVGRGVRRLRDTEKDVGIIKNECLVLDYTDTTEVMASLFNGDELDAAEKKRAEDKNEDMIECPDCSTMNSMKARRCCGVSDGSRCEYFYNAKICDHCHTENDTTARTCRKCGEWLIDPNEKLQRNHYTDADYKQVLGWSVQLSHDQQKVIINYILENHEKAAEIFSFDRSKMWMKAEWRKFCNEHIEDKAVKRKAGNVYTATSAATYFKDFAQPMYITHRLNNKGYSVINRKVMPWQEHEFSEDAM